MNRADRPGRWPDDEAGVRLPRLPHPAFVSSGAQLDKVITGMELGEMPLPEHDGERVAVWRDDIPREQAVRLARATGATDEQISGEGRRDQEPGSKEVRMPVTADQPPVDIPDGWVVWVEDGQVFMEEDAGGSPCSWPVEEGE